MRVYIAGKITGLTNHREVFERKQKELEDKGYVVINPSKLDGLMGEDFIHSDYMHICYSLIDLCDCVYFMENWEDSKGANLEYKYAASKGKDIWIESERRRCKNCINYRQSYLSGYISSHCVEFGSLDMDQKERHPDTTGATCSKWKKVYLKRRHGYKNINNPGSR